MCATASSAMLAQCAPGPISAIIQKWSDNAQFGCYSDSKKFGTIGAIANASSAVSLGFITTSVRARGSAKSCTSGNSDLNTRPHLSENAKGAGSAAKNGTSWNQELASRTERQKSRDVIRAKSAGSIGRVKCALQAS